MNNEEYILNRLERLTPASRVLSERIVKTIGKEWASPKEVSNYLGRHINTIYEKINDGEVLTKRIGRSILIYTPSLILILESH